MNKSRTSANERQAIYITRIKGVERFYILTLDVKRITITETQGPASETEVREAFKSRGMLPHEIDSLIANAERG